MTISKAVEMIRQRDEEAKASLATIDWLREQLKTVCGQRDEATARAQRLTAAVLRWTVLSPEDVEAVASGAVEPGSTPAEGRALVVGRGPRCRATIGDDRCLLDAGHEGEHMVDWPAAPKGGAPEPRVEHVGQRVRVVVPLGGVEHYMPTEDAMWLHHFLGVAVAEAMAAGRPAPEPPAAPLPEPDGLHHALWWACFTIDCLLVKKNGLQRTVRAINAELNDARDRLAGAQAEGLRVAADEARLYAESEDVDDRDAVMALRQLADDLDAMAAAAPQGAGPEDWRAKAAAWLRSDEAERAACTSMVREHVHEDARDVVLDEVLGTLASRLDAVPNAPQEAVERGLPHPGLVTPPGAQQGAAPAWVTDIVAERHAQDAQWGGREHDDEHAAYEWLDYIMLTRGRSIAFVTALYTGTAVGGAGMAHVVACPTPTTDEALLTGAAWAATMGLFWLVSVVAIAREGRRRA